MDLRYSELKFNGEIYTEQWKIDEILIKNKFNWMVNAEIKNARLEIFQDTLVWNAGIWYNGSWYFGVWRDGEWRYGTWQNGVWYNGVWRDGTFKSGIIYKGKFFKGKIEGGEIRGGQFIDTEIDPKVIEYTGEEYQVKKEEEQQPVKKQTTVIQSKQPIDQVRVNGVKPANQQSVVQPKIQQEKINYNMKKIKTFESFMSETEDTEDILDLIIDEAVEVICQYNNDNTEVYRNTLLEMSPEDILDILMGIDEESELYDQAQHLCDKITSL